jgi:iron complex outermembrane receptor protein
LTTYKDYLQSCFDALICVSVILKSTFKPIALMKWHIYALIFCNMIIAASAQTGLIKGKIIDAEKKEPLVGVNIIASDGIGTVSDIDGTYKLNLAPGNYTIEFKYIGYSTVPRKVKVEANQTTILDVGMYEEAQDLGLVVVSSSKYEKKIDEEIVSMEVMKQNFIEDYNANTADKALARIPGVTLIGEQLSIRGGSGYSGGAGSRVLVLLDGLPYATANNSSPDLNSLPMENLEQIEVIKGASSSLYGSSALNGVINVRTAWPKTEPFSKIMLFFGTYSNPFEKDKKHLIWWDHRPMFGGVTFAHRKKFEHFDFVIGGNYSENKGHLANSAQRTARTYIKTRWRPKRVENLSLGINANLALTAGDFFFLWGNFGDTTGRFIPQGLRKYIDEKCQCLDSLAYTPREIATMSMIPIALDPYVLYFDKKSNMHSLKGRYFFSRQRTSSGENTDASNTFGEYTFHTNIKISNKVIFDVVPGIMVTYGDITSEVTGKRKQYNTALFMQFDTKLFNRLTLTFGGRYEYIKLDTLKPFHKPIFRGGFNLQLTEGTYARASIGQGFRYPSVAEKFANVVRNGIQVIPNPDLKPENSWSAEVGIKQAFKISSWFGYFDAAGFISYYYDMIDYAFEPGGSFAFQAQNLLDTAQIAGIELSSIAQGKLFGVPFNFLIGYNYLDARELTDAARRDSTRVNFLNYRFRHSAKGDIQASYKKIIFGFTSTYNSFIINVERNILSIPGIIEFRKKHDKGQVIFDVRLGYDLSDKFKLMFLAKNIFNTQYSIRPALIEPPRNYTVQLSYNF